MTEKIATSMFSVDDANLNYVTEASTLRLRPGERPPTSITLIEGMKDEVATLNMVGVEYQGREVAGWRYAEKGGKRTALIIND